MRRSPKITSDQHSVASGSHEITSDHRWLIPPLGFLTAQNMGQGLDCALTCSTRPLPTPKFFQQNACAKGFELQRESCVFDNAQDLDRDSRIRELRAEGLSFKRIGAQLGITRQRVTQIWERMSAAPTEGAKCWCGVVFPPPSGPGSRRKYCSAKCRYDATRAGKPKVPRRPPTYKHCFDCKEMFEAPGPTKFCVKCQSATRHRRRAYYDALAEAQGGVCAICSLPEVATMASGVVRSLAVDHCHLTNTVRGLLCMRCNATLGAVRDDVAVLEAAAAYLRRHAA